MRQRDDSQEIRPRLIQKPSSINPLEVRANARDYPVSRNSFHAPRSREDTRVEARPARHLFDSYYVMKFSTWPIPFRARASEESNHRYIQSFRYMHRTAVVAQEKVALGYHRHEAAQL